jgi:hypothetical protein
MRESDILVVRCPFCGYNTYKNGGKIATHFLLPKYIFECRGSDFPINKIDDELFKNEWKKFKIGIANEK